ncbi:hypothetical protein BDF20DRAFT_888187 [Mycotypha africana]|uniref:uncharacterized protein n=1 Tax=Mycotypha africana TaxID=64632 RepID=UPI002301C407|nr:uncharacterized protein BDF20DRAFT_888187 [Mycotypha africana]KAI8972045.1 hypothetical protein BDF20DRAFT_888187 [Mycotypha africana]
MKPKQDAIIDPGRKTVFTDRTPSFYGSGLGETRFRLHQGSKRAADTMVNMLVNGGVKHDKELRKKRREEQMKLPKKKGKPKPINCQLNLCILALLSFFNKTMSP